MAQANRFWEEKALTDMSEAEWELLCDGCGKCCVLKLEDVDDGAIYYTDVSCRLLCTTSATCSQYEDRKAHVPDCVILTPQSLEELHWMPQSCAYRALHEGRPLPEWHPLITGSKDAMTEAGHHIAGRVISEGEVADDDMPEHLYDCDNPQ